MGAAKGWGGEIVGNSKKAGALGTGQFKANAFSYDEDPFLDKDKSNLRRKQFANEIKAVNNRNVTVNQKPQAEMRGMQAGLARDLQAQSRGQGPSLAQDQLNRATGQNIKQSMALAASQRGGNAAQGMRQVAQQTQAAQQQAARDSATMRIQEQMAARDQLAGVTTNARAQDIGVAQNQAQTALQQQSLNDAAKQSYYSGLTGLDQYDQNRAMNLQQLQGQQANAAQGLNYQGYESASNRRAGWVSGLAGGFGSMSSMSDERNKKNIKPLEFDEAVKEPNQSLAKPTELERLITGKGEQMSVADEPQRAGSAPAPAKAESKDLVKDEGPEISSAKATSGGISTGSIQKEAGYNVGNAIKSIVTMMSDVESKTKVAPLEEPAGGISSGEVLKDKGSKESGGGGSNMLSKLLEGMGGTEGAMSMASDKSSKKEVKAPQKGDLERFVDALKAYEYEYKDPNQPGAGAGKFVSPMAQDIEKTELGKGLVEDTPNGKMVNYGKAGGLLLATAAMVNDKVDSLEDQLKKVWSKKRSA